MSVVYYRNIRLISAFCTWYSAKYPYDHQINIATLTCFPVAHRLEYLAGAGKVKTDSEFFSFNLFSYLNKIRKDQILVPVIKISSCWANEIVGRILSSKAASMKQLGGGGGGGSGGMSA